MRRFKSCLLFATMAERLMHSTANLGVKVQVLLVAPFLFPYFFYMSTHDVPESDPSTLPAPELSFGQKAVGLTLNPG